MDLGDQSFLPPDKYLLNSIASTFELFVKTKGTNIKPIANRAVGLHTTEWNVHIPKNLPPVDPTVTVMTFKQKNE